MTDPRLASDPLREAAAVMDRLRSPGGCPWDAAQTHRSLAKYLLEETYETLEAIETGDLTLLREELGDLLLQVLFHARIAEELPAGQRFSLDDVARELVAKLVYRHPHVFADAEVADADEVNENWERLKIAEKGRTSIVDGVPMAQPALALAAKLVSRARRAGLDLPSSAAAPSDDQFGPRLLALVGEAVAAGVDSELALRETARAYRDELAAESTRPTSVPGGRVTAMTDAPDYRHDPPFEADEKTMLLEFLDYHRATLRWKCEHLTPEQLAARSVPSTTLSLLGIVRHMAEVERGWFDRVAGEARPDIYATEAEPDLDFDGAAADAEVVREAYANWDAEIAHSRQVAGRTALDATFPHERTGTPISLRWVLVHMIEEYARHNGHADLLREAIDGATGE